MTLMISFHSTDSSAKSPVVNALVSILYTPHVPSDFPDYRTNWVNKPKPHSTTPTCPTSLSTSHLRLTVDKEAELSPVQVKQHPHHGPGAHPALLTALVATGVHEPRAMTVDVHTPAHGVRT